MKGSEKGRLLITLTRFEVKKKFEQKVRVKKLVKEEKFKNNKTFQ